MLRARHFIVCFLVTLGLAQITPDWSKALAQSVEKLYSPETVIVIPGQGAVAGRTFWPGTILNDPTGVADIKDVLTRWGQAPARHAFDLGAWLARRPSKKNQTPTKAKAPAP